MDSTILGQKLLSPGHRTLSFDESFLFFSNKTQLISSEMARNKAEMLKGFGNLRNDSRLPTKVRAYENRKKENKKFR